MQVTDFRCLRSAELEFDADFTLISGPNGSGKTSLLESVFVLGRGRSFRSRHLDNLIRVGSERFVVFGEVDLSERLVSLGVEGSTSGVRARLGGAPVPSLSALAAVLPVQVIDPEVHRLIEEGPSQRRRFLDWGVFHVEHSFVRDWQGFQQALKQRNAALRSRQPRALVAVWDSELSRLGEAIDSARRRYVLRLAEAAGAIVKRLLGLELSISYRAGWARDKSLAEALVDSLARDQELGSTTVGPHRAELLIRLDGLPVRDRISRGQQKLLASALLVAQISLFPRSSNLRPTLLLDDPAAELDASKLLSLIREVSEQSVQLVVSSLNPRFDSFGLPGRCYQVAEGVITSV